MDPSATPPWRVLEAPNAESGGQTERRPVDSSTVSVSTIAKALGIGAAALLCGVTAIVLATGTDQGSVRVDGGAPLESSSGPNASSPTAADSAIEVVAEIVGAVQKPGVYRLASGSRMADLVRLAGGYGPRVDTDRAEQELNLAATVKDGDHVRVPSRDDPAAPSPAAGGAPGAGAGGGGTAGAATPVDLNRATQAELEALPGIGPATAQKIIAAREEAPFTTVDELRSRGVLGEKTFLKLRDLLTVG
jgi:competence protein ComEA